MILVIMMSWHRLGQAISSRHSRLACLKWQRQVAWSHWRCLSRTHGHQTSGLPVTQKETKHWYWWFWIVGPVCQGFFWTQTRSRRDWRRGATVYYSWRSLGQSWIPLFKMIWALLWGEGSKSGRSSSFQLSSWRPGFKSHWQADTQNQTQMGPVTVGWGTSTVAKRLW